MKLTSIQRRVGLSLVGIVVCVYGVFYFDTVTVSSYMTIVTYLVGVSPRTLTLIDYGLRFNIILCLVLLQIFIILLLNTVYDIKENGEKL